MGVMYRKKLGQKLEEIGGIGRRVKNLGSWISGYKGKADQVRTIKL
jgi:hypothetical protein